MSRSSEVCEVDVECTVNLVDNLGEQDEVESSKSMASPSRGGRT